jgi:quinohemoprotein ethanol dehydrogenase
MRTQDRREGQVWEQITVDQSKPYTITGAPRVVKGKVIIGNGGAELRRARLHLRLRRQDRRDGVALLHDAQSERSRPTTPPPTRSSPRRPTPPGATMASGPKPAAAARLGRHGLRSRARHPLCRHRQRHAVEPAPRSPGGGDNLFLSSIVALEARHRRIQVWHYQTTPGETWDYTATQPIMLADLKYPAASAAC